MGTVIDLVATLVAILGLLAAVGYGGYLLMLNSVASKRPGAAHLATDARKGLPVAAGTSAVALLGLLLTLPSGAVTDILGLLIAGGAGLYATNQLQTARRRLASPPAP